MISLKNPDQIAKMREAGALPPPAGASVVNANIDAAPDVENGGDVSET